MTAAVAVAAAIGSSPAAASAQTRPGDAEVDEGATLPGDAAGSDILLPPRRPVGAVEGVAAASEEPPLAAPAEEEAPLEGDARVQVRLSPCLAEVTVVLPPASAEATPTPATYLFALPPHARGFELMVRVGGRTLQTGVGEIPAGTPSAIPRERWSPVLDHAIPGAFADDQVEVRLGYGAPRSGGVAGGRRLALADAVIRGPRSHDTVRRHILRHRRQVVRYCRARRQEVISVTFVITARGAVTASAVSRSTTGDPIVDHRVALAVQRIPFPPLLREGVTVVTYPIALGPPRRW